LRVIRFAAFTHSRTVRTRHGPAQSRWCSWAKNTSLPSTVHGTPQDSLIRLSARAADDARTNPRISPSGADTS
jgi:hypothetical protein